MLVQQAAVEGVGPARRAGDHARKGDDAARRAHPFQPVLAGTPFGAAVEPAAPPGKGGRQQGVALRHYPCPPPTVTTDAAAAASSLAREQMCITRGGGGGGPRPGGRRGGRT